VRGGVPGARMNVMVMIAIRERLMFAQAYGVLASGGSLFLLQHIMIPHTFRENWIIDASVSVEEAKTWTVDFDTAQISILPNKQTPHLLHVLSCTIHPEN
jgi:hypothetical protein